MRLPVNHAASLILIVALAGCGGASAKVEPLPARATIGPAADYPMVLGDPVQIDGITYTPEDRLNYDTVGYAAVGSEGGETITASHKTLPLPSYIEVTALDSGKTALVRVERRGPMSDRLIELSPGAATQLGLAGAARPAVRVRRVNPPEQERASLRSGQRAPDRMTTPRGLLDALSRKLAAPAPAVSLTPAASPAPIANATLPAKPTRPARAVRGSRPATTPTPAPVANASPQPDVAPSSVAIATPAPPRAVRPAPAPKPAATAPTAQRGSLIIQVAAFSTQDRANGVATRLGARVSASGRLWRVRMGPFADRAQAQAALAKARAAGYSDARIQRGD